jgi:hypothetical protein
MESGNVKAKKPENDSRLTRFVPMETDINYRDKFGKKMLMQRLWQPDKTGRYFQPNLTSEKLKPVLAKARVKLENLELKDEGDFIVYSYKTRPLIKLNLKEGQFYSPFSECETYGKEAVQHQAHIVMDILKTNGLSNAVIGKPTFPSSARNVLSKLKTYSKAG